ncbi:MAG: type II secretion system protein M [Desulfobacteraceae bacterium]|nr:type II secretion system protein M [Desulfobacteraceae bacterium]
MKKMINLNRREKLAVSAGAGFVAVFLFFELLVHPVFEKRSQLRDQLASRQAALVEMVEMYRQHQVIQVNAEHTQNRYALRPAGFTLFSFMDRVAGETGVKQYITYMKPSSSTDETSGTTISYVELKLQDISLKDLTSYLFEVETSENMVRVSRLSISKTGETEGLLSVVMQAEAVDA